jgi:sugar phosphate isomerase/epimerase
LKAQLSRRVFLSQAATAVVFSAAQSNRAWASQGEKVGLQLYTVGTALTEDPAGTLKKIKAIGFEEVEGAGFGKLTPKALRGLIDDAGLQCPAAHLQFGFEETGKVLEQANELRVQYAASSILLPGAPVAGGIAAVLGQLNKLTADDYKKIAERANEMGEQAKKAGVQFAYHNHTHEFRDLGGGKTGYEILLAETQPGLVQFEADCGWMITAGANPAEYFRRAPERFRMIHIKDFPASTKVTTEMGGPNMPHPTQLGQGHIDYKPVIAAARRAGVKHFFVEQDPPMVGMSALEAATVDYKYARSVL